MDTRDDTLQLISDAIDKMTPQDVIEYKEHSINADQLFEKYYPKLSPIPASAIQQIISKIPDIIADYEKAADERGEYLYQLLFAGIAAEIFNQNDKSPVFDGDVDSFSVIPDDYTAWKEKIIALLKEFTQSANGAILLEITLFLGIIPNKKS